MKAIEIARRVNPKPWQWVLIGIAFLAGEAWLAISGQWAALAALYFVAMALLSVKARQVLIDDDEQW